MTGLTIIIPAVEGRTAEDMDTALQTILEQLQFHGHIEELPDILTHSELDAYYACTPVRSKSMVSRAVAIVRHHWPTAKITMRTVEEVEL